MYSEDFLCQAASKSMQSFSSSGGLNGPTPPPPVLDRNSMELSEIVRECCIVVKTDDNYAASDEASNGVILISCVQPLLR